MKFAAVFITILTATISLAQIPENLERAKALSNSDGKQILIEFYRPDCEYCQLAAHDAATVDSIKSLLSQIIHLPVDVTSESGAKLVTPYYVGDTFPLFVLADSLGQVLYRWLGYINAASFIMSFNTAMASSVTVSEREQRFRNTPTFDDALFLARYYEDIDEYLKAVDIYRQVQSLETDNVTNYSYDIFRNFADAAWNDKAPFDSVRVAADNTLSQVGGDIRAVSGVARIISNVARKTGNTDKIAKYLQAGIDINARYADPKSKEAKVIFMADLTLYEKNDTTEALSQRKSLLPIGWNMNPQECYNFSLWCLERKINMEEVDNWAYQTALHIDEPEQKAMVLYLVAKIREARDHLNDAVAAMEKASELEPNNTRYSLELERLYSKAAARNKGK